ncbi:V-type ATP synthase subunit F [bacterium]|nr:V-type ATP synthase subunit F [bacterium]
MLDKVAIVGPPDLLFAFKALGVQVYSPQSKEEARKIIKNLEKEEIALCFLHQDYMEAVQEEKQKIEKKFFPVIVGFSDYREVSDQMEKRMREMSIKATGSDSLVKKRGKDETR